MKTLNHVIIYNPVFSSVCSYDMTNNVQMATLQAHVQVRECRAARFSESCSKSGFSKSHFTNPVFRKILNPVPNPVFSNPGSPGPGPVGRTCTPELRHSRTH